MTREMDYILRILRTLYHHGQLSAAVIAEAERIPRAMTVKLLKRLHAAGLVESRRGTEGGYRLTAACRQLSLYQLLSALEERLLLNRCQRPGYQCENDPKQDCSICRQLTRLQGVLDEELRRIPIAEMF